MILRTQHNKTKVIFLNLLNELFITYMRNFDICTDDIHSLFTWFRLSYLKCCIYSDKTEKYYMYYM